MMKFRSDLIKLIIPPYKQGGYELKNPQTEAEIATVFANWLRKLSLDNNFPYIWIHVPNEFTGRKNSVFGARLAWQGKHAGVADYIFLSSRDCFVIELKKQGGILSPKQKLFKTWCDSLNVEHYVAFGLNQSQEIVNKKLKDYKNVHSRSR